MATYLFDFDALFNRCGNMKPVEGAVDFIQDLRQQGHRIVLLTKDRCQGSAPAHLTLENPAHLKFKNTEQVLTTLGVPCDGALEGATGPFVLINDEEALAIHLRRNRRFSRIAGGPSHFAARADSVARVYRALAAVAWTAWKYEDNDDADDYVQTMLVAKSFASCGGFDHADLVARHRAQSGYRIGDFELPPGGVHPLYKGQVAKLQQSDDPFYEAADGVSDGAAMKISAVAAFYANDFQQLVENTNRVARITHATVEARLAAVLVALRIRQVLLGVDPDNMHQLVEEFAVATEVLQLDARAAFFLERVERARRIATRVTAPTELLYQLCRQVGMDHLAWSTPVTACFWSFHRDADFSKWFRHHHPTVHDTRNRMYLPRRFLPVSRVVHGRTLKRSVHEADARHLRAIGQYDDFQRSHGYHWRTSVDVDTFLSIAISILAVRHGLDSVENEIPTAIDMFGDDLWSLAEQLVQRPHLQGNSEAA
jgi:ADP-ribosylglycohydrolase